MQWFRRAIGGRQWAARTLAQHFAHQDAIETNYKLRDDEPGARDAAVDACWRQIALAPEAAAAFRAVYPERGLPTHAGFHRLRMLREAEGDLVGALRLAGEAQRQGWAGSWGADVARCQKGLEPVAR
jgi:hypothetical protein